MMRYLSGTVVHIIIIANSMSKQVFKVFNRKTKAIVIDQYGIFASAFEQVYLFR